MLQKTNIALRVLCVLLTVVLIAALYLPYWDTMVKVSPGKTTYTVKAGDQLKIYDGAQLIIADVREVNSYTPEDEPRQVSVEGFAWAPTNYSKMVNEFDKKNVPAFKEFYVKGTSFAASVSRSLFPEATCFRDLEGTTFGEHFLATVTGVAFFGASVWLFLLAALSIIGLLFSNVRKKVVYLMVPLSVLGLMFALNNPYLATGTTGKPVVPMLIYTSVALLVISCVTIVLDIVIYKQKRKK